MQNFILGRVYDLVYVVASDTAERTKLTDMYHGPSLKGAYSVSSFPSSPGNSLCFGEIEGERVLRSACFLLGRHAQQHPMYAITYTHMKAAVKGPRAVVATVVLCFCHDRRLAPSRS